MHAQKPIIAAFIVILAVAFSRQVSLAADAPVVLARVGGGTITSDDLIERARQRNLLRDDPFTDTKLSGELLDDLVRIRMITLEAERLDLSQDWDYRSRARLGVVSAALQLYQNEVLLPGLSFDSVQIDSYYHAHIERYTVPRPQRRIRQITVYKEGFKIPKTYMSYVDPVYEGWNSKRKIDSIYTRLANGEDFGELAYAHSEELKAKASRGNLGWISPKSVAEQELTDVFFTLPLYMISKPFETEYGWLIAQVTGERGEGPAPIDQFILGDITQRLTEEVGKMVANRLTDSLVAASTVEYNDEALALPDTSLDPGTVLAVVNERDTIWAAGYRIRKHSESELRAQRVMDAEQKREVIKPAVRLLCLYGAMREWGYLDREEILELRRKKHEQRAGETVRMRFTTSTYAPDSSEITQYYEDHMIDFAPERRHLIQSRRYRDRDSARAAVGSWRDGVAPPGAMAHYVSPSDLPAPVWNRMAAVPVGTVIGPISAKGEYWAIRLDKIVPPQPLTEVWPSIASRLREQYREQRYRAWLDQAARRHGLARYDERLDRVRFPSRHEFDEEEPDGVEPLSGGEG